MRLTVFAIVPLIPIFNINLVGQGQVEENRLSSTF